MRQLAANDGCQLESEMAPFLFSKEGGGSVFRQAPFVFVQNLIATVSDRLSAQQR